MREIRVENVTIKPRRVISITCQFFTDIIEKGHLNQIKNIFKLKKLIHKHVNLKGMKNDFIKIFTYRVDFSKSKNVRSNKVVIMDTRRKSIFNYDDIDNFKENRSSLIIDNYVISKYVKILSKPFTVRTMLHRKASLKKYFYFTLICGLSLILGLNISNYYVNDDGRVNGLTENEGNVRLASNSIDSANNRLWFFKNGKIYPKPIIHFHKDEQTSRKAHLYERKLFPDQDPYSDRILNQLMYVPNNYEEIKASGKLKTILLYHGLGPWNITQGRDVFLQPKCPVDTCDITYALDRTNTADMIIYKHYGLPNRSGYLMNTKQVTMFYQIEPPYRTRFIRIPNAINWTATYRLDSDIVIPYGKWMYYNDGIYQMEQDRNYAANKTKKVAWFVSNCRAQNKRLQYARELAKYIDVDIYGACGNLNCSRSTADKCFELLERDYKFYLAFENSNCRDYITEKFFVNALSRNILPIVMGVYPEEYEVRAPYRSYIHVDKFTSVKELADYLHVLDKDDKLYNSYFNWKGTGEFINTYFWCRVCAALHDEKSLHKPRWYKDINYWWRGTGICTNGSWYNCKSRKDIKTYTMFFILFISYKL